MKLLQPEGPFFFVDLRLQNLFQRHVSFRKEIMEEASNIDKYSTIDQDAIRTSTLQIDSRRESKRSKIFFETRY